MFGMILTVIFIVFFSCNNINDQSEFTVSFDADGGYFPDNKAFIVEIKVKSGKAIDNLPVPQEPATDTYFGGWYTQKNGAGDLFDSSTIVTANLRVFAKWTSHEFENDFYFDEETFLSEWDSWNNQNIKNYSFILHEGVGGFEGQFLINNLIMPLDAPMPFAFKIIVKDDIMDSFEIIESGGMNTPYYTSISHMYQSIYDNVQAAKKNFEESGYEYLKSITVHIRYGSMHYITFYGKSYDYKEGYEISENGLTYGISDFQIIE
jgi:hypothetical protein